MTLRQKLKTARISLTFWSPFNCHLHFSPRTIKFWYFLDIWRPSPSIFFLWKRPSHQQDDNSRRLWHCVCFSASWCSYVTIAAVSPCNLWPWPKSLLAKNNEEINYELCENPSKKVLDLEQMAIVRAKRARLWKNNQ